MDPEFFDRVMLKSIGEEIAARDFYKQAALQVKDPGVAEIFERLSREENEHRQLLETFRFNPLARVEFERIQDYGVAEQEDDPAFSFSMSPREALQLAMKKEQRAAETYRRFADACRDSEMRRIYSELAEMERGHKVRLEALFVNTAYPECW
jgi:rubrerythrin